MVGIFLGYGNYSFGNQMALVSDSLPISVAKGDFNKDNILDIAVANQNSDNVGLFLGYGNGSFSVQKTFTAGPQSGPIRISVADINSDSSLDIVVLNYYSNTVGVLLGYGNGSFAVIKTFSVGYGSQPFSFAVADFNNDTKPDTAVANNGTDSLKIMLQTC